jgi:hypothetical protein
MASSLGGRRPALGCQGAPLGERYMERDGRTSRPPDFSISYRFSRRALKKLIDTPALTKMTVLLAKNKEMKIHTAARIAARYTTGACANSIARRLVKHFPVAASEIMNRPGNDGRQFVYDRVSLSHEDNIIFINILQSVEGQIEEDFLLVSQLSRAAVERLFSNFEWRLSHIILLLRALFILRIMRPAFYRKIIFDLP